MIFMKNSNEEEENVVNDFIKYDAHLHTNYSPDADVEATFERYLEHAQKIGLKGLTFTDHVDFDSVDDLFKTIIDYDTYFKRAKEAIQKTHLEVGIGVEIGDQPHVRNDIKKLVNRYDFDFVIGSIHYLDGLDFYNGDFFKGYTQHQNYQRYFEGVLESVTNFEDYDVFGHIDYITRYGGYDNFDKHLKDYHPIIEEILKIIIKKNKGIEINTSGLRNHLDITHPNLEILKMYKRLGGSIITIGSDAHQVLDLAKGYDEAIRLLKIAGFKQISIFKKRKPIFIDI
jgi:histidinol-phosphatase (PHP family)